MKRRTSQRRAWRDGFSYSVPGPLCPLQHLWQKLFWCRFFLRYAKTGPLTRNQVNDRYGEARTKAEQLGRATEGQSDTSFVRSHDSVSSVNSVRPCSVFQTLVHDAAKRREVFVCALRRTPDRDIYALTLDMAAIKTPRSRNRVLFLLRVSYPTAKGKQPLSPPPPRCKKFSHGSRRRADEG